MSWQQSTLGEECELYQPQTLAKNELDKSGVYKVYGANGVIGTHSKFNHEDPQLLVTCRGATCGTINISEAKSWINGNAMVVKPRSSNIDLYFLSYYLHHLDISKAITGAAQPQITRQSLAPIKIQFPPLPQQQRIAAILDKASEIKAKREQAIAKLDELAQSTFVEMFGEQLSSSTTTVNDFFQVNVNRYETNLKDTDNVAFVPMSAVSEISKSIENEETKTYSDVRKGYTPIKRGDLIVAKITPCYENGKQAIATVSTQFAYGSTEFHTFRSSNKDLVTLLHYYLQTKKVMREGAANMKGAAGQRRVPDSFFKSLPFSLPATNELSKFGAVIASQNKRRAEQIRQLAVIENTIQSLQHQAFTTGFTA